MFKKVINKDFFIQAKTGFEFSNQFLVFPVAPRVQMSWVDERFFLLVGDVQTAAASQGSSDVFRHQGGFVQVCSPSLFVHTAPSFTSFHSHLPSLISKYKLRHACVSLNSKQVKMNSVRYLASDLRDKPVAKTSSGSWRLVPVFKFVYQSVSKTSHE